MIKSLKTTRAQTAPAVQDRCGFTADFKEDLLLCFFCLSGFFFHLSVTLDA